MLHILLTILKILGIIILIVLGLVLFLVLTVLFVPISYRLKGKKADQPPEGEAIITWLFGLIRVRVQYKENTTNTVIRIFGISLQSIKQMIQKIKGLSKKKEEKVSTTTTKDLKVEKSETIEQADSIEPKTLDFDAKQKQIEAEANDSLQEENQTKESFLKKIGSIIKKVLKIPSKVMNALRKIKLTITNICDKIKYWKNFLNEETTKETIRCVKNISWRLIRHILPRKVKGFLKFGFEDPSTTGQILGAFSLVTPLYKSKFRVIPVFEDKVFECDIQLKGRIYGCVLAKMAIEVYRNQAVKQTIKKFQHKEA